MTYTNAYESVRSHFGALATGSADPKQPRGGARKGTAPFLSCPMILNPSLWDVCVARLEAKWPQELLKSSTVAPAR